MAALMSCSGDTVYCRYAHTNPEGWLRSDTVRYVVDGIRDTGRYDAGAGVRITDDYPFTSITLCVVWSALEQDSIIVDTITVDVFEREGNVVSNGITYYTFTTPIRSMQIADDDSLSVSITHCMAQDTIRGISDVGLILNKRNNQSL